jgi:hypothetical protein
MNDDPNDLRKPRCTYNYDEYDAFDTEFGNAVIGTTCGLAMIICIIVIFMMLIANINHANAGELDAWEFQFFGVNYQDVKDREWTKVVVGGASSIIAHELGHMVAGELLGMGSSSFDFNNFVAMAGDGYHDSSSHDKALFSAAGFIVQGAGSIILTSIPATRHSDFTVGWNTATMCVGTMYGITGGTRKESSDVKLMEDNGWPGTEIAFTTGAIGGITTYYSLDKVK